MKIEEYSDGYCITHKGVDYKYQGKSDDVLELMLNRIKLLLRNE
jgi:hypothetical protein